MFIELGECAFVAVRAAESHDVQTGVCDLVHEYFDSSWRRFYASFEVTDDFKAETHLVRKHLKFYLLGKQILIQMGKKLFLFSSSDKRAEL